MVSKGFLYTRQTKVKDIKRYQKKMAVNYNFTSIDVKAEVTGGRRVAAKGWNRQYISSRKENHP